MPLDKQDLAPGTTLVGTYKKAEHRVLVLGDAGPEQGYELDGGTIYKSLSSAAKAVMGGISANGWRFWSLDGGETVRKERVEKVTHAAGTRGASLIRKVPNQKGVDEASTKWFCSSCMASFVAPGKETPETCPEGHPRFGEDEFAAGD